MRLGEAYVNVRADLKPYYRDLQVGLRETTAAFEKQLNKELGRRFGKEISQGAKESLTAGAKDISASFEKEVGRVNVSNRQGLRRSTRRGIEEGFFDALRSGQKLFTFIASSLASALDDGISALPVQVKAAITAGLIAVTPILIAQFGAIVAAGIALGTAGLGIALASQLQPVQDAFAQTLSSLRNVSVAAAGPLIDPLISGMQFLVRFVERFVAPRLESIFTRIGPGIENLIRGIGIAVDQIFQGLQIGSGDIDGLLTELANSAVTLGIAIGEAFRILLSTGQDGRDVLRDLVFFLSATLIAVSAITAALVKAYGAVRDITMLLRGDIAGFLAAQAADALDEYNSKVFVTRDAYGDLVVATDAETKALEAQAKAAEENAKALDKIVDAANSFLDTLISVEKARDDLNEAIKENGRTLDIDGEKGRENAEKTQTFINRIRDSLIARVEQGEITAEQAEAQFNREIAALERTFGKTKQTKEEFQRLFGAMIAASKARLDASPWITAFNKIGEAAKAAIDRIRELSRVANSTSGRSVAPGSPSPSGGGGGQQFADGGRITKPTVAVMGEGFQPELVLPETKPQRAAEILANSTLAGLIGGAPTTVIAIFDGEPFQARIVRTAQGVNNRAARNISQVPRSI